MEILVIADVHENKRALEQVLEKHPRIKEVFFCGDGLTHFGDMERFFPECRFHTVPGNCDFAGKPPYTKVETVEGKRILFTHGHKYGVKYDLYNLEQTARQEKADLVLFGHTHIPYEHYEDGITYFNPGSLGYEETYGVVQVCAEGILTNRLRL